MTENGNEAIGALYAAALVHSAAREDSGSTFSSTRLAIARSPELQGLIAKHASIISRALETLSEERRNR